MNNEIAEYDLESIESGLTKQFKTIISESLVSDFAQLSGDFNPLHMDESYAQTTDFKKRICHGMLLASFFSKLVGMYIPGRRSLYLSQTLKFISPCYIGDEIIVKGTVISKSDVTRIINLKTSIIKNSGEELVRGDAKIMVRK